MSAARISELERQVASLHQMVSMLRRDLAMASERSAIPALFRRFRVKLVKTGGEHAKGATQNCGVYEGTPKGAETATGEEVEVHNRFADVPAEAWALVANWLNKEDVWEMIAAECNVTTTTTSTTSTSTSSTTSTSTSTTSTSSTSTSSTSTTSTSTTSTSTSSTTSTSTSTTSTTTTCTGNCEWQWIDLGSGFSWYAAGDSCSGGCYGGGAICTVPPVMPGSFPGQTTTTPCPGR